MLAENIRSLVEISSIAEKNGANPGEYMSRLIKSAMNARHSGLNPDHDFVVVRFQGGWEDGDISPRFSFSTVEEAHLRVGQLSKGGRRGRIMHVTSYHVFDKNGVHCPQPEKEDSHR